MAGLGGRLDQTLANIYLLNLPQLSGCDVRLDDGVEEVSLVRTVQQITGQAGDTVSLLPISPLVQGITTVGLQYPLNNEDLVLFHSRGVSNVMTCKDASVEIQDGILLCVHIRKRIVK